MTRKDFEEAITKLVNLYIGDFERYDSNPQIYVDPATMFVDLVNGSDFYRNIEDSDEAVENAAGADRPESEDADDYQVRRNPDFYPVKTLFKVSDGVGTPDAEAISVLAAKYF